MSPTIVIRDADAPEQKSWRRWFLAAVGRLAIDVARTAREIMAFTLISVSTAVTKRRVARSVIGPMIRKQIVRSGVRLFPAISLIGLALGFVIVNQTVAILSKVGATNLTGLLMISAVFRELGPLAAALTVMARTGTATVIELGTNRAMGEVEALEALGIDPIHYLVVPRMIGLTVSVATLSIYLTIIALASGYLFGFMQGFPLTPSDYLQQLASALRWEDFVFVGMKTASFGAVLALIICFNGLAQPLSLEEVAKFTTRTVAQSLAACLILDAVFIAAYLLL